MDDMRVVFIVVGLLAILGLLVHGLWSLRRNSPAKIQNRRVKPAKTNKPAKAPKNTHRAEPEIAPIVDPVSASDIEPVLQQPEPVFSAEPAQPSLLGDEAPLPEVEAPKPRSRRTPRKDPMLAGNGFDGEQIDMFAQPEAAPMEPEVHSNDELPAFSANTGEQEVSLDEPELTAAEQLGSTQPQDWTASGSSPELHAETQTQQAQPEPEQDPQDVLVLYVVAKRGPIQGAELLPNLLTQGFKFGDMDIFHRHQSSAGTGPVLFSMANMRQPGTFDLDAMEQFSTDGVVLFMTLPCKGDARVSFSLMEGAARGLAELHGAEVLDDRRESWGSSAKATYLQRIQKVEQGAAFA